VLLQLWSLLQFCCSRQSRYFLFKNVVIQSFTVLGKKECLYMYISLWWLRVHSSTVWDPHLQKDINRIENVQRRAARFIYRHQGTNIPALVQKYDCWECSV
jgi:hypothetical protein